MACTLGLITVLTVAQLQTPAAFNCAIIGNAAVDHSESVTAFRVDEPLAHSGGGALITSGGREDHLSV